MHILFLGSAECPNLIALDVRAWQIDHDTIREGFAGPANLHRQLGNGAFGNARHADGSALRIALYKASKDACAVGGGELIHGFFGLRFLRRARAPSCMRM